MNDPYAFIDELCHISSSQRDILRDCPFVGEAKEFCDDATSASPLRIPLDCDSNARVMHIGKGKGKAHGGGEDIGPQPDKSALPASGDVVECEINKAACEVIDLTDVSDQRVNGERGIKGAGVGETSKRIIDKGLSSKDVMGELRCCGNKSADKQPVLPPIILEFLENAIKEEETQKGDSSASGFDVLKGLSEKEDLANVSWLQLAKACGFNFPRPAWRWEED